MNIQYVSTVTSDKDKAKLLKCKVRKNKNLYIKNNCTWDELKTLIINGCTIARVGTKSEYIALDIDESEITHEEMKNWAENYGTEVLWTKSISGKQYKHHVYFHVDEFDVADIKDITNKCFSILGKAFPGKFIKLDKNAWSYWQCMYNVGNDTIFVLDGSIQLNDWCCKFSTPVPYIIAEDNNKEEAEEDSSIEEYLTGKINYAHIPNNVEWYKELLKKNSISMEYYKTMPWESVSMVQVKKGHRHSAMYKLVNTVVKNLIVNQFFGVNYTIDDAIGTIKNIIECHYEEGSLYFEEDKTSIINAVKNKYNDYMKVYKASSANTDYDALVEALGSGKHRASIKTFAKKFIMCHSFDNIDDACIEIVDCWDGYPEEYDTTLTIVRNVIKSYFNKKKTMKIIKDINEAKRVYDLTKDVKLFDNEEPNKNMSFEDFCSKSTTGDVITFDNENITVDRKKHKKHSNKGKCLDGYTIEDNTVTIPKSIKVSSAIRKYCSNNNIKIVRS